MSPESLAEFAERAPAPGGRVVVTDSNVLPLIPQGLRSTPCLALPPGEVNKSWTTLEAVLNFMVRAKLDSDGEVIAVGGGVVTDLAGLAASLFHRGIAWCAVPTSLIGQVDAAIGGKSAVNLGGIKNVVGAFHPPQQVLVAPHFLKTLPDRELRAGLGEVLKTAILSGEKLFAQVERLSSTDFRLGSPDAVAVIRVCLETKEALVKLDPRDSGVRRLLNLGHTFGHAFEANSRSALLHGEAVGLGLLCAARLGALHFGHGDSLESRVRQLLVRWGLPTSTNHDSTLLVTYLRHDKKRRNGNFVFVAPRRPGDVEVIESPPEALISKALLAVSPEHSTSSA
ncbi:MAG: 3-dehydroquinate synthase [Planctomycetota bacterium]